MDAPASCALDAGTPCRNDGMMGEASQDDLPSRATIFSQALSFVNFHGCGVVVNPKK
jgi:hypothetical protein